VRTTSAKLETTALQRMKCVLSRCSLRHAALTIRCGRYQKSATTQQERVAQMSTRARGIGEELHSVETLLKSASGRPPR
jgi:hypothetical protein